MTTQIPTDHRYKQTVSRRFSQAVDTYDQHNLLQQEVLKLLRPLLPTSPHGLWLDLGCGTGESTRLLSQQLNQEQIIAADLSPAMLMKTREKLSVSAVCADAEALPFAEQAFAGIWSSLAIQWCLQRHQLFKELHRVLDDQGELVISTLLEGSLEQFDQGWRQVDGSVHHNRYPSAALLETELMVAGFTQVRVLQRPLTLKFTTLTALTDSLRKVGASTLSDVPQAQFAKSKWRAFSQFYESLRCPDGLPLTYQVGLIYARKRNL